MEQNEEYSVREALNELDRLYEAGELEKLLVEMAVPKKKGIERIGGMCDPLVEHLLKCVVYGDTLGYSCFEDWRDEEVCQYLANIYNTEVQCGNGKLKAQEYHKIMIKQGDSVYDYYSIISLFRTNNRKTQQYPDFKPTMQMAEILYAVYMSLIQVVCPLFATPLEKDKNGKSIWIEKEYFAPIVKKVFEKSGVK